MYTGPGHRIRLSRREVLRKSLLAGAVLLAGALAFRAAALQAGPERIPHDRFDSRFRIEADRSKVVDEVRRLVWQRCSYGQAYNGITCAGRPRAVTFREARKLCAKYDTRGQVWRLPRLPELESLADPNRSEGARIDPAWFPATDPFGYWTGSHFSDRSGLFWSVYHFGEARHFGAGEGKYLVRCVTEWFGD